MTISSISSSSVETRRISRGGVIDRFCRAVLLQKLGGLRNGRLTLVDRGGSAPEIPALGNENAPLNARLTVNNPGFYRRALLGGSVGAGASYADGDWDCDDLTSLCRLFVADREFLRSLDGGLSAVLRPANRLLHRVRRNTVRGSRENISAHYDLGNDFFSLFLDETWMYSCGVFPKESATLAEASTEKNDRICRKLGLSRSDHVLEIGTGWGGFALHAAKHYGCRLTTTTISRAQYEVAKKRVREAGLENRIELLLKDYRVLKGRYDKLVSIEMIEAVGLDNLGVYFRVCGERLKPSGAMLLQSIIIQDRFYEQARKSVDFIQRYIFPGSGIPSVGSIIKSVARHTDMRLFHQEDFSAHYARTLRCWSERLRDNRGKMHSLGYPDHLYRLWQFYFGYCESGFAERQIGLVQMLLTKPDSRMQPLLGIL